jgi:DNA polymerase-3 subunit delta
VICYKYKTLDKRKKDNQSTSEKRFSLRKQKLYEQVGDWIKRILASKSIPLNPNAMLVEFWEQT